MSWSFERITITSALARGGGHQLERAKVERCAIGPTLAAEELEPLLRGTDAHERLQQLDVFSGEVGTELVDVAEVVRLAPATIRASLLVGTDRVELLTRERGPGRETILELGVAPAEPERREQVLGAIVSHAEEPNALLRMVKQVDGSYMPSGATQSHSDAEMVEGHSVTGSDPHFTIQTRHAPRTISQKPPHPNGKRLCARSTKCGAPTRPSPSKIRHSRPPPPRGSCSEPTRR
jgi:hypothetical protein